MCHARQYRDIAREKVGLMTRYLTRDLAAVAAAVLGPLALAAILLPWRGSWSNTNVALLLVAAVVAVACLGNRFAGVLAALSAAVWFDYFFTQPYERLTISRPADVTTFALLLAVGVAVSQMAAWARRLKAAVSLGRTWSCGRSATASTPAGSC